MKYYKIIRGYGAEEYIVIDETELEKAYYAFLTKKDGLYSGGAIRGSEIIAIQPDWHRAMGWNRGYSPLAEDWGEIRERGVDRECRNLIEAAKEEVQMALSTGRNDEVAGELQDPRITKMRNEFIEKSRMLPPQKKAEAQEEAARQDRQDKG